MTNRITRNYLKKGKGDEARIADQIREQVDRTARAENRPGYKNEHRPGGYNRTECPVTLSIHRINAGACEGCGQDVR